MTAPKISYDLGHIVSIEIPAMEVGGLWAVGQTMRLGRCEPLIDFISPSGEKSTVHVVEYDEVGNMEFAPRYSFAAQMFISLLRDRLKGDPMSASRQAHILVGQLAFGEGYMEEMNPWLAEEERLEQERFAALDAEEEVLEMPLDLRSVDLALSELHHWEVEEGQAAPMVNLTYAYDHGSYTHLATDGDAWMF